MMVLPEREVDVLVRVMGGRGFSIAMGWMPEMWLEAGRASGIGSL